MIYVLNGRPDHPIAIALFLFVIVGLPLLTVVSGFVLFVRTTRFLAYGTPLDWRDAMVGVVFAGLLALMMSWLMTQ